MHILGSMKCGLFQFDIIKKYTLLIMARLKQAYYGSCFVASCMHLQLKKVDPFITKRAHQISVTWAHTLLFLGNTLPMNMFTTYYLPPPKSNFCSCLLNISRASLFSHEYFLLCLKVKYEKYHLFKLTSSGVQLITSRWGLISQDHYFSQR